MKRLIYILFFLPIFVNGQILEKPSYPFQDYAFDFSANYIDLGEYVQGQTAFDFKCRIKVDNFDNYIGIFNCKHESSTIKGMYLRINITTGEIVILIADGSYQIISTGINLIIDSLYDIEVNWDGLIGTNNIFLTVNGSTTTYSAAKEWTGNSAFHLEVGKYGTSQYYFPGKIYYFSYIINGNPEKTVSLSEGHGSTVYEVTTGTAFTINGTVTQSQWITQTDCQYNEDYGVTKVKYNGDVIFVPYKIDKTPIYNHSNPIMDASELFINYPADRWGKTYWVK